MAGIYIHIPFCKQACHYCDFHFSTSAASREPMVSAIIKELKMQKSYLENNLVETIYFGGGTPSLLSDNHIKNLLSAVKDFFPVIPQVEISLEANPDDLSSFKLERLRELGINRLSMGIQSFHDEHLRYLNRAHNATESLACVNAARQAGFDNISIDLIYGIPAPDHSIWKEDLDMAVSLNVEHLSAYCLTIEPRTVFGNWLHKGKITEVKEEFAVIHFEMMQNTLVKAGYEQYEISNFCKSEMYSKHNSSYWKQKKYLGVGPSAHSFNGVSRQFNVRHNQKYIKAVEQGTLPAEVEMLTQKQVTNEYLLTTIRTKWGSKIPVLRKLYGNWDEYFETELKDLINSGLIRIRDDTIYLTEHGKLLGDEVTLKLFLR